METTDLGLLILRLGVGLTFVVHGAQKVFGWWGGPGWAGWSAAMHKMGFEPIVLFAAVSSLGELLGGMLLALGLLTPMAAAVLIAQAVVIIGQVHWERGFLNAKGGFEFPLLLGVGAVAVLLIGAGALSVDAAIGFVLGSTTRFGLVLAGIVVGLAVLAIPRLRALARSSDEARVSATASRGSQPPRSSARPG